MKRMLTGPTYNDDINALGFDTSLVILIFCSGPTTFKVIVSNIPIEAEKDELEVLIKEFDTMEIANSGESQTVTVTYQTKEHADK